MMNRLTHRIGERLSAIEAMTQHAPFDTGPPGPLGYGEPLTIVLDESVRASVSGLFERCAPAAIARAIWAVVVDAINGVPQRWARPHVVKENGKVGPFCADRDASAAITRVIMIPRIEATLAHRMPCFKLWRICHAMCGVLRGRRELFDALASTACRMSEGVSAHHDVSTTVAATMPASPASAFRAFGSRVDDEPAKSLTDQIDVFGHLSNCNATGRG